jgi:hypothetical protein
MIVVCLRARTIAAAAAGATAGVEPDTLLFLVGEFWQAIGGSVGSRQ